MRILFVTSTPFLSEPLGVMGLAAICRREGHQTRLALARGGDFEHVLSCYRPQVVAYSAMTTEVPVFAEADAKVRAYMDAAGRRVWRIMGGPHPTFSPSAVSDFGLDAICQGDGDAALPEWLRRIEAGAPVEDISNIATTPAGATNKQLHQDLDALPFAWREDYYRAVDYSRDAGLRSFMASRGCPYHCTYCFNHAYNEMFRGAGPLLRRRSVGHLIEEIEYVIKTWPPVRLIRFGDDTFSYKADDWLEEFVRQYRTRVGLPFYCLMRSNTLTDETARLLAEAGCQSLAMSIESGCERARNDILERSLSDETVIQSFKTAHKYGMRVLANTMLGIPGTTLDDDWKSLEFARRIRPAAPTFGICCPYPGTRIWSKAVAAGQLDPGTVVGNHYQQMSTLTTYTQREKDLQARMCFLGTLYCLAPRFCGPAIRWLMRSRVPVRWLRKIGLTYMSYRMSTRIFPQAIPRSPRRLLRTVLDSFSLYGSGRRKAEPKHADTPLARAKTKPQACCTGETAVTQ